MKFPYKGLVITAAVLISLAAISVQGQGQNSSDGAAVFKAKCAMCHGTDGTGKTPMGQKMNIRDMHSAEIQKQSDVDLARAIAQGKGKMPAYGKTLSDGQIKLLVSHVRELSKK
jgi:mono/diheme cytochrome c family protein